MVDHTEAERAKFEALPYFTNAKHTLARTGGGAYDYVFTEGLWVGWGLARATQASAPADLVSALDRMDALLDPAAGLLAVPDDSATAKASRRDMALIRARLLAQAAGEKPPPVDATASLIEAARAVVARWHTPAWKEVEHTAAFIARLDEASTRAAGAALRKLTTAGQAHESYEVPVIDCRTCVHIGPMKDCTAPFGCAGGSGFERRSALQLWR